VVVVALLQGLGTWFYLLPQQQRLEQLQQQEISLKSQVRVKAEKVAALPQLKAQLDELTTRYQFLLQQLPLEKELATMLASVNQVGLKNGLEFSRIDWGERQPQEFFYRLPLNMELQGTYDNVGQFSAAIAKLPRIISLYDVEWERASPSSTNLKLKMQAYTYQFKPEANDE
jgi:type IV pilus assembly protein PilO